MKIRRPGVDSIDLASVAFIHSMAETSCSDCHTNRPTTTDGFFGLNPALPFDYNTHGNALDCATCHADSQVKAARGPQDWAGGYFAHPITQTTCISCHTSQKPPSHTAPSQQGECFACHSESLKSGFSSLADWRTTVGLPSILVWNPDLDLNLVTQKPQITGSSITSLTPETITIHMGMNHQTSQVSSATMGQCMLCHTSGTYVKDGLFHSVIPSQPGLCSDCHDATSLPRNFVGLNDIKRNPQSPSMRHDAVTWSKNAAGAAIRGTTAIVANDCAICHKTPPSQKVAGLSGWENSKYHTSLTAAGISQPSSCLDCHANSRIENKGTLTAFNHSTDARGMGDCLTCHAVKADWTAGQFHNLSTGALTSCNSCHNSQRPSGTVTVAANGATFNFIGYDAARKPFDLTLAQNPKGFHGGTRDCKVCHSPTLFTIMGNWVGGKFHTVANNATVKSCNECHNSQRPAATINVSALNGLAQPFSHTANGQGECIGCHKATVTRGVYDNFLTANPNTWGDTDWRGGLGYDPTGLMGPDPLAPLTTVSSYRLNYSDVANSVVASVTPVTETLQDQLKHSSLEIPDMYWTNMTKGDPAGLNAAKCVLCHTNLPTQYSPGKFHTVVASAGLTSCKECHVNTVPTEVSIAATDNGALKFRPMDHDALLSGGATAENSFDCLACHLGAQSGTSFNNAVFHTKLAGQSAQNCTVCHQLSKPSTAVINTTRNSTVNVQNFGKLDFAHVSSFSSGDCMLCHSMTNAQIITKTINSAGWVGGLFHSVKAPNTLTSCMDCHTTKPTTRPTVSNNDSQKMSHSSTAVRNDCYLCHKADLTAGVTPTLVTWSKSALFHRAGTNTTIAGDTVNSCQECHGLTNGGGSVAGTNNDIPAGLTNSSTYSTYPSNNATVRVLIDQMRHTDINVASVDCNRCHSNTANFGLAGTKWKSATPIFHTKVPTLNASTSCLNCHGNILTYIRNNGGVANGFDHSVAGINTQDCKGCHKYPGTGAVGSTTNPPNWKGAASVPSTYTIPSHTVSTTTVAGYTGNHTLTNTNCTSCHGTSTTFKTMIDFDHQGLPANQNSCSSCHLGTLASVSAFVGTGSGLSMKSYGGNHHRSGDFAKGVTCVGCHTTTRGANTFNNVNGITLPAAAKAAYISIGCGSVNATTFSCHNGGQFIMTIPTNTGTTGKWR